MRASLVGSRCASHDDDDLALGVSCSLVPESFRDITQAVAPVDDGRDLAGFDEILQNLRQRGVPEIVDSTPHTLRRTYISLLLAAGCDPAYVQQQVGHTDPTLTLRIYQQLLKRKRREEYRTRVNELLGTSPAALSRLPEPVGEVEVGPNSGPNSLFGTA
jgi:hypothetical protein